MTIEEIERQNRKAADRTDDELQREIDGDDFWLLRTSSKTNFCILVQPGNTGPDLISTVRSLIEEYDFVAAKMGVVGTERKQICFFYTGSEFPSPAALANIVLKLKGIQFQATCSTRLSDIWARESSVPNEWCQPVAIMN